MDYKYEIFIAQCDKYLLNDPLNLNLDTPSSNIAYNGYGTPKTLPKYTLAKFRKEYQPGGIPCNQDNIPE